MKLIASLSIAGSLFLTCAANAQNTAPPVPPPDARRNVAILVYPGVELLDFAGPGEVFACASVAGAQAFRVYTVGVAKQPVTSQGFVTITPEFSIADCPKPAIVVVPGGAVPTKDTALLAWIKDCARDGEVVLSVCNGALLLARAGLLADLEVATHESAQLTLAIMEPKCRVAVNRRFVDNGRIVTSAGVSAGIDGALHVVERLCGDACAKETARHIEYDWRPEELAKLHAHPARVVERLPGLALATSVAGLAPDAQVAKYRALENPPSEVQLNAWGYTLFGADKSAEAVALLTLALHVFPTSANVCDSLSDVCEATGKRDLAKQHAERALALLAADKTIDEASRKLVHNASASRVARLTGTRDADMPYACTPCNARCDAQGFLAGGPCPTCGMALVARTANK